jgi:hypothetical protein
MTPEARRLLDLALPPETIALLSAAPRVTVASTHEALIDLAVRDAPAGASHQVAYEVPERGRVVEVEVCRTRNGICANYLEPYMRRRDPDCLVIGDDRPTDKPTYESRFGGAFDPVREETFDWLKTQPLAVFAFHAGLSSHHPGAGDLSGQRRLFRAGTGTAARHCPVG